MPYFFNEKSLSDSQLKRWDSAVATYTSILDANDNRPVLHTSTCPEVFAPRNCEITGAYSTTLEAVRAAATCRTPGNPKSALFSRLLSGKQPLKNPPPVSFGYPWFDVIEGDGPWDIFDLCLKARFSPSRITEAKRNTIDTVVLNQDAWNIVRYISESAAIVTHRNWASEKCYWFLKLDTVPAEEAVTYLCANYDPSISRITTLAQLHKEKLWQVSRKFRWLPLALDNTLAIKHVNAAKTLLSRARAEQEVATGRKLLQFRQENNLPNMPTPAELKQLVEGAITETMASGYSVNLDGTLNVRAWRLHKLTNQKL